MAVQEGFEEVVSLLLTAGADVTLNYFLLADETEEISAEALEKSSLGIAEKDDGEEVNGGINFNRIESFENVSGIESERKSDRLSSKTIFDMKTTMGVQEVLNRKQLALLGEMAKINHSFHAAAATGNITLAEILLSKYPGLNINYQDGMGWSPLFAAALNGHIDIVSLLLSKKYRSSLNVDASTYKMAATPLFGACHEGHAQIVAMLVNSGCDVNKSDKRGGKQHRGYD